MMLHDVKKSFVTKEMMTNKNLLIPKFLSNQIHFSFKKPENGSEKIETVTRSTQRKEIQKEINLQQIHQRKQRFCNLFHGTFIKNQQLIFNFLHQL
jgi:hypothetical protein